MFFLLYFLYLTLGTAQIAHAEESVKNSSHSQNLKTIIRDTIPFRADGKIEIPKHIKHVKLDIGLSYNAPMSQQWLSSENDLMVFGFEPNPASVISILQGTGKRHPAHGDPLEKKFIGSSFFLIPCALGLSCNTMVRFFVTKEDCGCSSLYYPKFFDINQIIEVPIFSLADFFDIFPFDTHPIIDYIKIDAQGSDLSIAKSAGHYLAEKVVYITLQTEDSNYVGTVNSYKDIDTYMQRIGFIRHVSSKTSDPTYFNPRFATYVNNHTIQIYQKG